MLKSTDGGTTWNGLAGVPNYFGGDPTNPSSPGQGWYDTTLAVDPTDANTIYAGGAGDPTATGSEIVWSDDGGMTWNDISGVGGNANGPHADHHGIAFDANGNVLVGTDGGIWRLDDRASPTWTDLNGNLQITQFTGIALDPMNPDIAYGGSQDNGTEMLTGGGPWKEIAPGDGGFVRIDCTNPMTIYHTFAYGNYPFLERSDDGGSHWVGKTAGIDTMDPSNFYPPYVLDPANPSRLLLGTNHVYETTNRGDSWAQLGSFTFPGVIDSLAVAPTDGNTIYATAGGHIFVTTDRGNSWNQRDVPGVTDHFEALLVSPFDKLTAYAVRDRFGGGHVFQTTDGGQGWSDISGNLPDLPTNAITLDPRFTMNKPVTLYVGTDSGVYASADLGVTWKIMATGLPNVQVVELALNTDLNILAAAAHGRGMWEIGLG
jgi:hypothetical protein